MKIDITVNQVYLPFMDDDTRTQLFFGGSSSGKSFFLAQRCALDVLKGRNYLIVRDVQKTIKRSVFNEITKAIGAMGLSQHFEFNKSDLMITCKLNNRQILFGGLDDPEKIKSITPIDGVVTDVWVEEATETKYEAVKQLQKRLRGQTSFKKRLILSFNPVLKSHWIFKEYFGGWDETKNLYHENNLLILKTTFKDNDFLEDDDVNDLENEPNEYFRQVYSLGNWGILGKIIYDNYEIKEFNEDTLDNFYFGLDFGFNDPNAWVKVAYDKRKDIVFICEEFKESELTNPQLIPKIEKKMNKQKDVLICDSAEPDRIQEFKQAGFRYVKPAKKGAGSIQYGIDWIKSKRMVIHPSCKEFIKEIQGYQYKKDRTSGEYFDKPDDNCEDHLLDALRYALNLEIKKKSKRIRVGKNRFM